MNISISECINTELYTEFETVHLTKIIFELSSQYEFKEGHPSKMKISVNDPNIAFGDIWPSI